MTAKRSVLIEQLSARLARGDTQPRVVLAAAARTPHPDLQACKIVYGLTGPSNLSQDAGMITAYAWAVFHRSYTGPVNANGVNLGAALRHLGDGERLFVPLVSATRNSITEHIVAAATALGAARSIPDWHLLHYDIYSYLAYDPRRVLRRWATGLYHQPATKTPEEIPA